jgi:dTDP-4-amino-4,6-dideoxygalactose transaminase
MTTGEGGMLTTNDGEVADKVRLLASHGRSTGASRSSKKNSWEYQVTHAGYKANMTDIQASIGIHQLRRLDGFVARRREIAQQYCAAFADLPELLLPSDLLHRPSTYHLYTVRIGSHQPHLTKPAFMNALNDAGIGTSVHFVPLHRQPFYYKKYAYPPESFPVADSLCNRIVSLPLYPGMSASNVNDVIQAVRNAVVSSRPAHFPKVAAAAPKDPGLAAMT